MPLEAQERDSSGMQTMSDWQRIEDNGEAVIYVPFANSGRSVRLERKLPSGSKLVTDHNAGLGARFEVREHFDWETFTASGRELNDDDVTLINRTGGSYVVLKYQDFYDAEGFVTRSQLRFVEEYEHGHTIRSEEFERDVEAPEHLRGTVITDEVFVKK